MATESTLVRQPLFSGRIVLYAALLFEIILLFCLWATTVARDWSLPVVAGLSCLNFLLVFSIGEIVRWRLRISLKIFLGVICLVAIFCALFGSLLSRAVVQQRNVAAVMRAGGGVGYDFDNDGDWIKTKNGWILPSWVLDVVGDDFVGKLTAVSFFNHKTDDVRLKSLDLRALHGISMLNLGGSPISDEGIAHLAQLTDVTWLSLGRTGVTDDGLRYLDGYQLEELRLHGTAISDAGLKHLYKHSSLRVLTLQNTKVSDRGVLVLQKKLPKCKVYR